MMTCNCDKKLLEALAQMWRLFSVHYLGQKVLKIRKVISWYCFTAIVEDLETRKANDLKRLKAVIERVLSTDGIGTCPVSDPLNVG